MLREGKRVEQNVVLLTQSLTQRKVLLYYTQSVLEEAKEWILEVYGHVRRGDTWLDCHPAVLNSVQWELFPAFAEIHIRVRKMMR